MRRSYLIDHRLLFLFGFVFYLFTPLLVGSTNIFEGLPGVDLFRSAYQRVPEEKILTYLWVSLPWIPAFFLGHAFFSLISKRHQPLELFPATVTTQAVSYLAIPLLLVLVVFSYLGRGSLFGGYGSYDIGSRGKLSTLLMIFNFFLLYQLVSRQRASFLMKCGIALCCVVLLSMGGRMYVFHTLITLLVYKTSFSERPWKLPKIMLFLFGGFVVAAIFGIWRMGTSVSLEKAAYSVMAEPTFTWFSTISYLLSNDIPSVNFPSNFLTSFLNLVPNTFISLKPYIVSTASMVKDYQNPLGADSVWSTFVINFGSAGSSVFIFFTGFLLNCLRHYSFKSRFWAVYYLMVCGLLPFQFFRDGFYILHKQLLFNFLLLPSILLLLINCLIQLTHRPVPQESPTSP